MRRFEAVSLTCALLAACSDEGGAPTGTLDSGADRPLDAGAQESGESDAGPASCDLSGIWLGRMNTQSIALGVPQYANNWYYFELAQQGDALTVVDHMDCGIEVQGTVSVVLSAATTRALSEHNRQIGRKGTVTAGANGACELSMERFWSVRGVSEAKYVPNPRNSPLAIADLPAELKLPPEGTPSETEDWDSDGKPAIAWIVQTLNGQRHTAQRDWTRYFTAPGYEIRASSDFRQDLVVRAEFNNEEVVYAADSPTLRQLAQPDSTALHTLTLRHLGRTRADARAQAILRSDPLETCANVRAALPAKRGL